MHAFTPFVEAGAAGLVFDPRDTPGAATQTRAALVYGGGVDLDLAKAFFVRAEYRGFVYDSPTYSLVEFQGADRITHRAEPSVGFGYRF
jgi:opacity protein-like surface antigen